MPLSLALSKEQMRVASNLINGSAEWEDLSFDDKLRVLEIHNRGVDVTDTVEPSKLSSFQSQLDRAESGEGRGIVDRVIEALPG